MYVYRLNQQSRDQPIAPQRQSHVEFTLRMMMMNAHMAGSAAPSNYQNRKPKCPSRTKCQVSCPVRAWLPPGAQRQKHQKCVQSSVCSFKNPPWIV